MFGSLANFTREQRFRALVDAVQHCTLCPRMAGRARVLSEGNGNIETHVLFVGEAPGRLGADRTRRPLTGDRTGENFQTFLDNIGWRRSDIFITNSVLCNPRTEDGRNAPPSREEIANCSAFLQMTLEVIEPDVVVSLGTVALGAIAHIHPHRYELKSTVRNLVPWGGRLLMPLYHPSQRAAVHRALASQRADYYELSKRVDPRRGLIARRQKAPSRLPGARAEEVSRMAHAVAFLLSRIGEVSKFKLTKLLYLADLAAVNTLGRQITGAVYLRQTDGPWPPEIDRALQQLARRGAVTLVSGRIPLVCPGPSRGIEPLLPEEDFGVLLDTVERYGSMTNSQIKTAAYMTLPMRELLRRERSGERTLNKPVLYTRSR